MSASQVSDRMATESSDLDRRCDVLRSLHVSGTPLLLPNAWDAASAQAVVAAGFPVVATTSGGVAAALGYEDHEHAPAPEMLAAGGRIARSVEAPVTVDAEAGYGMEPVELVTALQDADAAGCNLEDTNHAAGELRDPESHTAWLRAVREAANVAHYPLVINARIDVFLSAVLATSDTPQRELLPDALRRARAYVDAGVDCVFPIALWEVDALREFVTGAPAPVNVLKTPRAPSFGELGIARVSYGSLLHRGAMQTFGDVLQSIAAEAKS
jgi:2-methylisocitrate lyase-like PEP mutase family enzyme